MMDPWIKLMLLTASIIDAPMLARQVCEDPDDDNSVGLAARCERRKSDKNVVFLRTQSMLVCGSSVKFINRLFNLLVCKSLQK